MHTDNPDAALQIHSSAKSLKLVTFDADGTLYADGCHMEHDNEMVSTLCLAFLCVLQQLHVAACDGSPKGAGCYEEMHFGQAPV